VIRFCEYGNEPLCCVIRIISWITENQFAAQEGLCLLELPIMFSPYRAVNTLHLGYKNQSVNAV
jgi:hypothetical protein